MYVSTLGRRFSTYSSPDRSLSFHAAGTKSCGGTFAVPSRRVMQVAEEFSIPPPSPSPSPFYRIVFRNEAASCVLLCSVSPAVRRFLSLEQTNTPSLRIGFSGLRFLMENLLFNCNLNFNLISDCQNLDKVPSREQRAESREQRMRSSCVVREGVRLELAEENQGIEEGIKTSSSSSSSSSSSFFSASASDLERIPLSPGDFLRWLGQGAYTAVGVRRKQRHPSQRNHPHPALEHPALPFWSQHLRRLESSVRTLSKHQKWFLEEGKEEEDCWDSTTSQLLESITAKDLDDAIQPSLVEALKGVWEDLDEVEGNDNEREVVMLTIALKPNLRKGKDGSATNPLTCYVLRCILPVTEKPVSDSFCLHEVERHECTAQQSPSSLPSWREESISPVLI